MRTIGYKHRGPLRDHTSFCDYCGVAWLRSELTGPDEDGYFRCPDDRDGRSAKELDYIRALNSAEPAEVNGARDRPGQPATSVALVGWAWVMGGTGERIAGTLRAQRVGSGLYAVSGAPFTTAQAFPFDPNTADYIPRFYYSSILDESTVLVRGHNRLGGTDDEHGATSGTGAFVVLAYAAGGEGVLTEVAWAWVSGAGVVLDSEGDVTVARTSTGLYTATLGSGSYTVAHANQFASADVSTVEPAFVYGSRTSTTAAGIRATNNVGVQVDADFLVRLYL